ncbi:amidohydrolase family protein [Actinopolymorpha singaporensis]|nr:amidohydrolase family protein [Actinopolymorpha singaporensis]
MAEGGVGTIGAERYPKLPGPSVDLHLLRDRLLDRWQARYAVLNCGLEISSLHNEDWALAMARAVNDWLATEWLAHDTRLRGSIVVPPQSPGSAAEEIDRLGRHPGFVQVLLPVRAETPLGKRRYWPIYEAAERNRLAVGIFAGGTSGNPTTPVGWPSYYLEDYVSYAQAFQAQVVSLVSEGVFTKYPRLRVVLTEGGFTWLPGLMWRFDKNWKGLRREVPWVDRPPSQIIRDHVRLTTQPLDEPDDPKHLVETIEQLGSDELLMFATNYPHWQFDSDEGVLPSGLPREVEHRILAGNAHDTYTF